MLTEGQIEYLASLDEKRANEPVIIKPYNPEIERLSSIVIGRIKGVISENKVLFMGASVLRISGLNDLDIFVFSSPDQTEKNVARLRDVFGAPTKNGHKWTWLEKGFKVSVNVIDPEDRIRKEKIKFFEIIRDNPSILKNYEEIKLSLNGRAFREYQEAKMLFMNETLKNHGNL